MTPLFLRRALLAALVAAHVVLSLAYVVPGHLSIDEGTYHFMARGWSEGRGLEVWNGYRERPSPELAGAATLNVEDGRLVGVPPELYPALAAPFFRVLGYRGLFAVNAVAFLPILALTGWIARRLTGDRRLALDAILILGLATYLWDYAQAAWPHATSALFVLAAFAALLQGLDSGTLRRRIAWAAVAGLVAGAASGIRLDAAFALPVLALPLLFHRPVRWRSLLAYTCGAAGPLLALAAVNLAKFDRFTPWTYGRDGGTANSGAGAYLALAAAGALALAAAWIVHRRWTAVDDAPPTPRPNRHTLALAAGALGLGLVAVAVVPALLQGAARLADGALQLAVDLRFRGFELAEPAMGRLPSGAVVYVGGLKKALLQSCPYLGILVLAAWAAVEDRRAARTVLLTALVPAAFFVPYAFFAWHGGLSLNLRYFVPTLPFLALLTAFAIHRLPRASVAGGDGTGGLVPWSGLATALLSAGLAWTGLPLDPTPDRLESLLLDLPLALAAALATLSLAVRVAERYGGSVAAWRRATLGVLALALVHAGVVALAYDVPRARQVRAHHLETAARIRPALEPDCLLFTAYPDPYYGLLDVPRLRLAVPFRDNFQDFRPLLEHHLDLDRPVYLSMPQALVRQLSEAGAFSGLDLRLVRPGAPVVRLFRAAPPPPSIPGGPMAEVPDG